MYLLFKFWAFLKCCSEATPCSKELMKIIKYYSIHKLTDSVIFKNKALVRKLTQHGDMLAVCEKRNEAYWHCIENLPYFRYILPFES